LCLYQVYIPDFASTKITTLDQILDKKLRKVLNDFHDLEDVEFVYASGVKHPSKVQVSKIQLAIRDLANELKAVKIYA